VFPVDQLNDNPSESKPGYSFIENESTKLPVEGKRWLFYRIIMDEFRGHEFVHEGDGARWKEDQVKAYMRSIRQFKEKLLVLIHISRGQPARATELLTIRHCKTRNGGRRNNFRGWEDGVRDGYHKGYSVGGSTKIIHRYLPPEVGELLLYYLWLMEPFQRQLEVAPYGQLFGKGYLWESGPESPKWKSEVVKRLIGRESLIGMGVRSNISSYRQIAIAITRKYLKEEGFMEDREDEDGLEDGDEEERGRQRDSVLICRVGTAHTWPG